MRNWRGVCKLPMRRWRWYGNGSRRRSYSPCPPEYVHQHLLRQLAGRRILLAWMIRADQPRQLRCDFEFAVVAEHKRSTARYRTARFKNIQISIESDFAECHYHLHAT